MKNKKNWIAIISVAVIVILLNAMTYVIATRERLDAEEKLRTSLHNLTVEVEKLK